MTSNFQKKLQQVFGVEHLKKPLFYNWSSSLRFELADNGTYTERFYQALNRAISIFRALFADNREIYVVLNFYKEKRSYNAKPYKSLIKCGFQLPTHIEHSIILSRDYDENDPLYKYQYVFKTNGYDTNIYAILWAIISYDIGIEPTAEVIAYSIDFDKKVIFHAYDDRGLDVVSLSIETIRPLYEQFTIGYWNTILQK